VCSDTTGHLG